MMDWSNGFGESSNPLAYACEQTALTDAEQMFRRTFSDLQPFMQVECLNAPPAGVSATCLFLSVLSLPIDQQISIMQQ